MTDEKFPALDAQSIAATRDALHAYARVLGGWASTCRKKRKHWWHASLRPSLYGLSTGVVYGAADFALELDFANAQLHVRTCTTDVTEKLCGQPSRNIATLVQDVLVRAGVDGALAPGENVLSDTEFPDFSATESARLHRALGSVAGAMEDLRAGIREEKSPIQVWPHHFDLSMIWLPGHKVPGQDPADEEHADKQMNFGFTFGDDGIPEPYFYVTAYPLPDALPEVELPAGSSWRTEGFDGAVALYADVVAADDPRAYLLDLWRRLLDAGREHLAVDG